MSAHSPKPSTAQTSPDTTVVELRVMELLASVVVLRTFVVAELLWLTAFWSPVVAVAALLLIGVVLAVDLPVPWTPADKSPVELRPARGLSQPARSRLMELSVSVAPQPAHLAPVVAVIGVVTQMLALTQVVVDLATPIQAQLTWCTLRVETPATAT
jgi:hypothetical protein